MNRYSKFILSFTAFLSACSILFAAGNSESAKGPKTAEVKIWVRQSGPDAGFDAIINAFNEANPDTHVSYEYYGENYPSVVQMAFASGNAPDIVEASAGITVNDLAKSGNIVPLTDVLTPDLVSGLHPNAFSSLSLQYKGEPYSVPVRISGYRLYYNRDIFKKCGLDPDNPPKTLEELREYAKIITKEGKGDFYGFGLPLGVNQIWERVIDPILIAQNECGRYGYNVDKNKYMFETNKRFFNFYIDLMKDGSLFPGYLTMGIDPLRANFHAGKVGMYIDGNWMVGQFPTQFKGSCNYDIAPLPVFAGEVADKYWAESGLAWCITNGPNKEAAKKFYAFWLSHQELANQFMPVPRTYLAANRPENLPTDKFDIKGIKYGFKTDDLTIPYFEPHYFIVLEGENRNRVFTNLFAEATQGSDISKKLDAAIDDLNKRYSDAFNKALKSGAIDPSWIKK
ncbi:ABC transporter substrate-binding protein [Treponema parvum]|uniref:ABC transporter substrate-binding protein n=1 Tax=Treponema parvum TaxID=138851 RepID=UPI001AEC4D4A|nr:sugar ABC transporter substrate-binding protein [Treponema parvum]QTQ16060.1 sugar ABC transporter substrate-binding protein [Treponema parvum]